MADLETSHAALDHAGLTGLGAVGVVTNECRNFPSIEKADDAQPEWWEESAGTCTLTEVDVAGESITETWERCLKVVTTADVYAYQRYTYADEPRLKSGRTVSARVAVWAVGGVTARVRLQSSVGSLGVATTTSASWTILTVEGVALTGTYVDLRFEVNNGTAYFVPLAFGVGSTAPSELPPRGMRYVHKPAQAVSTSGVADPATWTDLDLTSVTSPLCAVAAMWANCLKDNDSGWDISVRRNGAATAENTGPTTILALSNVNGLFRGINDFNMQTDDGQVVEYFIDRWIGNDTFEFALGVRGWWEWA